MVQAKVVFFSKSKSRSETVVMKSTFVVAICACSFRVSMGGGDPYGLINKVKTDCEFSSMTFGSMIVDSFNVFDEATERDVRIHQDNLVENLGFSGWIQSGLWKNTGLTANKQHAPTLQKKGGWSGHNNVSLSSYWPLENKWLYMMGDSTQRQVWANDFEKNAKEYTRDKCKKQFPHRKIHPVGGHFEDEGWGGKCGLNEVTCDLPGFGADGKITYDWKHFPYEDYDEWVFGPDGVWSTNSETTRPDVLVLQIGLHTCVHAFTEKSVNQTMIDQHEAQIPVLMNAVKAAVERPRSDGKPPTVVIVSTAGRQLTSDPRSDHCTWKLNRIVAWEAHKRGFPVFEREELEHRLLFKSEHSPPQNVNMKPDVHLDIPGPQIVATTLLNMISCLALNGTQVHVPGKGLQAKKSSGVIVAAHL